MIPPYLLSLMRVPTAVVLLLLSLSLVYAQPRQQPMVSQPILQQPQPVRGPPQQVQVGGSVPVCTPFQSHPTVMSNFEADKYAGVWYEIATTTLARNAFEEGCVCSYGNYTRVRDPEAARALGGRALFDVVNTCRDTNVNTGTKRWSIGQMLQINSNTDKASFDLFLVPATANDKGHLIPLHPPQQGPGGQGEGQPMPPMPMPGTPAEGTPAAGAAPSDEDLEANLNPTYFVLSAGFSSRSPAANAPYDHALVAGPCQELLWILSRQQTLSQATYNQLVQQAKDLGFRTDTIGIAKTLQTGCAQASFP